MIRLDETKWLAGFNYVASTAVNSTEMWRDETYDRETIKKELALAAEAGYVSCRVFIQFLVWANEREVFLKNFENFLTVANSNGLSVMPVLFDDCAFAGREPYAGAQDAPRPGVHNGGWTPSPGASVADDPGAEESLAGYIVDVIGNFKDDRRIIIWDLYNEPGNNGRGAGSLSLVHKTFRWARAIGPTQPLTVGVWEYKDYDLGFAEMSDVVTFHDYSSIGDSRKKISALKKYGRPMICTEWLHRPAFNTFANHLPLYLRECAGAYNWGLVAGKTQTYLSWDTIRGEPDGAPALWQHDVFHPNGEPYDPDEIAMLREINGA